MKVSKLTWKKKWRGWGEKPWPESSSIRGDDGLRRAQPGDKKD